MKMIAVKMYGRDNTEKDFVELDLLEEINYISLWQRTKNSTRVLAFHTDEDSYIAVTTLIDIALICHLYGYEMIGNAVVNNRKIAKIETIRNNGSIVTFIGGKSIKVKKQV